ncbi:HAMP domain-containing protein [Nocardioides humilatus]|uniref:HAMP domain-containing protein n=1 Tax=Nocardioides humilatus TaxID=2607660 RepID=A0A5B1L5P1_9ACTN|nr:ATP-binding protein [Nocardioides humilatus]KAA1415835.1 HAMP domain-containing protein [Nocardioides humilatus]
MVTASSHDVRRGQPWLDALYDASYLRLRERYVEIWLIVSGSGIVLVAWPAQFWTLHPLWGPGPGTARAFALTMICGVLITAFLMPWTALRPFRPISQFLRGEEVDPAEVWYAAVRRVPRVSMTCTAAYCCVGNVAAVIAVGEPRHFTPAEYVSGWLVASIITSAAGFFFVLIWEVAFRPVLREVQPLLPADFEPGRSWLTLGRRSALATASVMAYTGAAVSSLVSATTDRELAMAIAVVATIGSAVTFGGLITGLVSHSIFSRVSELMIAIERIGQREHGIRVAVHAGDELDDAAISLNRMAERIEADETAVRASRARLASVADRERQRMERDLRRRVLARLQRITDDVAEVEEQLGDREALHSLCATVRASVADAEREIQRLARGVYPAELTEAGLDAALTATTERMVLPSEVLSPGVGRFDRLNESSVYFCCNEALQNAAKHAGPDATVEVRLSRDDRRVYFEVVDTGRGFEVNGRGRGLQNMRDRIRAVGGDLVVVSAADGLGTTVSGWVPT